MSQYSLKKQRRQSRQAAVVRAAVRFCSEPENIDAFEELQGSISTSLPVSFLNLMEAVMAYSKETGRYEQIFGNFK